MGLESQQDWLVASDGGYGEEGRLKKAGGAHEGRVAGPARAAGRGPMELEREGPSGGSGLTQQRRCSGEGHRVS